MCGRFNFLTHKKAIAERFGVKKFEMDLVPRYNIAPTQQVAVIIQDPEPRVVGMRWGLIPFWAKDPKIGNKMINARSETIDTKRVFSHSFKKKRCLIPATGFYEWQKTKDGKRPMHIRLQSKDPFAFAGIYSHWKAPTETIIMSCSILTTQPNDLLKPIHDRMPVILDVDQEDAWLDSANDDIDALKRMLDPFPSNLMEVYEVSTYVNNARNDGPQCTQPAKSNS